MRGAGADLGEPFVSCISNRYVSRSLWDEIPSRRARHRGSSHPRNQDRRECEFAEKNSAEGITVPPH